MLHGVQLAGITAAGARPGFGFIMEQGLGKTLTTLAEMMELWAAEKVDCGVILCPNSFKSGWVDEIEKWNFDKIVYHIFESGDKRNQQFTTHRFEPGLFPVLIINYEAIRSADTQLMITNFVEGRKGYIAADESIQISTHNSNQTKAAIFIAKHFAYRRILSGKWMKQGPHDAWSQMRFIGALDGFNYFAFKSAFCKMGGFRAKQVMGVKDPDRFANLIAPWVFTATKTEWTDLPPKLYTTRQYIMTPEMQRHFDSMYHDFMVFLEDESIAVDVAITKYIKLAQIQAGFIRNEDGVEMPLCLPDQNPRLNALHDLLENEVQGKVCIPYHHRYSGALLEHALAAYRPAYIRGGMHPDEIREQKVKFNTFDTCRVILLQTRASKYGHTLLGDQDLADTACRTMIFYENTYSLDDRSQIEDRMHRHGQKQDSVLYIDLVGTLVDRNMIEALQRKEDLYQALRRVIAEKRGVHVR